MMNVDFANADGKKMARIMKGGANEYYQFPQGRILTSHDVVDFSEKEYLPNPPAVILLEV